MCKILNNSEYCLVLSLVKMMTFGRFCGDNRITRYFCPPTVFHRVEVPKYTRCRPGIIIQERHP